MTAPGWTTINEEVSGNTNRMSLPLQQLPRERNVSSSDSPLAVLMATRRSG